MAKRICINCRKRPAEFEREIKWFTDGEIDIIPYCGDCVSRSWAPQESWRLIAA